MKEKKAEIVEMPKQTLTAVITYDYKHKCWEAPKLAHHLTKQKQLFSQLEPMTSLAIEFCHGS